MTRILAIIAATLSLVPLAAQAPKPVTIQLLAINDLHGNLEPPTGADGLINSTPAGGAEYLATHLAAAARDNPNTLLVAAGDLIGASPLISGLSADHPTIEAANAMHLAVTSIGNHELDHGVTELLRRIQDAHYEYLAANMVATTDGHTILHATSVRAIGGVKIGFIGETLEDTEGMIGQQSASGLRFLEESAVANQEAAKLEQQGVHTIVLLIHQGGSQSFTQGQPHDPNGCVNLRGAILPIVARLSPSIKVVVSAHTHQFYNCTIDGRTVTSASSYGRMFTRISLTIDPATDELLKVKATNVVVTRDVVRDPAQTAIIAKYLPVTDKLRNQPEGAISAAITQDKSPAGESAMGDLIADAQLAATSAPGSDPAHGGAVIAFMNSGGIRNDLVAPDGQPYPHPITYGDLYTAQPFGNRLITFTLTGDALRRLLEQQFDSGQLLQVSAGLAYSYRRNAPRGSRIVSMTLNGRPIVPTDKLRITASDFVAQGNEGLVAFREKTDVVTGVLDLDSVIAYFAAHSPVGPTPRDRITRLD